MRAPIMRTCTITFVHWFHSSVTMPAFIIAVNHNTININNVVFSASSISFILKLTFYQNRFVCQIHVCLDVHLDYCVLVHPVVLQACYPVVGHPCYGFQKNRCCLFVVCPLCPYRKVYFFYRLTKTPPSIYLLLSAGPLYGLSSRFLLLLRSSLFSLLNLVQVLSGLLSVETRCWFGLASAIHQQSLQKSQNFQFNTLRISTLT